MLCITMSKRRSTTCQQVTKIKRRKTLKKEVRNWIDLPLDVLIRIFMKLGVIEILVNAQKVCSLWREVSKEPQIFRSIIFREPKKYFTHRNHFENFAKEAVDRSCGQLVKLSGNSLITEGLVNYIVDQSNPLKSLRLGFQALLTDNVYIALFKRLDLLEDLVLSQGYFERKVIEELGRSCQNLKYFRLNLVRILWKWKANWDEEAFAIAENLPQLRRLCLVESTLSNRGLQAILDGCPQIEYLDLRNCFNIDLGGEFFKRCVWRIRNIKIRDTEQIKKKT